LNRRSRLALGEVLPIARQLARGLHAAHSLGIVHRDLKPANVMLVREKEGLRVAITDFGLARRVDHGTHHEPALTQEGRIIGTPAYMAPEQVNGEATSAATDVYSFGIMMYEMLSGQLPFDGDNPWQMAISRVTRDPPDIAGLLPELDTRVVEVVRRCLERRSADRFDSMLPVLERLDRGDSDWHPLGYKASDYEAITPPPGSFSDVTKKPIDPSSRDVRPVTGSTSAAGAPESRDEGSESGSGAPRPTRRRWAASAAALLAVAVAAAGALSTSLWRDRTPAESPTPELSRTWEDVEQVLNQLPALRQATVDVEDVAQPSSPTEALEVARSYLRRLQPEAARAVLNRAFAADAENPHLLSLFAEAHWFAGRQESAEGIIKRAWDLAEASEGIGEIERTRIWALHQGFLGDWRRAQQTFTSLWLETSELEDGLWLVRSGLNFGTTDRMSSVFEALRRLPGDAALDVRIDLLESRAELYSGSPERSLELAKKAANRAGDEPGLAFSAWARVLGAQRSRMPGSDLEAANRWAAVLEREPWAQARLHHLRGLNLVTTGLESEAYIEVGDSLRAYRELGSYRGICSTVITLGNFRSLDLEIRLESLDSALDACRRAGDERKEARVLMDMARVHRDLGDYSTAVSFFQKSSDINEKLGFQSGLIQGRISLSLLLTYMGRVNQALETILPAEARLAEAGDEPGRLIMAQLLACQYSIENGDMAAAEEWMAKASTISTTGWRLSDVHNLRGVLAFERGDAAEARRWAQRLLELSTVLANEQVEQRAKVLLAVASTL
ncbi:MAG: serine/threonine-protein kinase, partial [Acidobacteriota bacterium]